MAENSNCFTTKYENVNEQPVITRSTSKITHLGTAFENIKNFFMGRRVFVNDVIDVFGPMNSKEIEHDGYCEDISQMDMNFAYT